MALAPQPSLERVGALVERVRTAGRDVRLNVEGTSVPVPTGLDVAGYRVLEEALAAAPDGPATVTVRWLDRQLELEVVAGPAGEHVELPLGLRERVALYGGDLRADRNAAGYAVRVRLPLSGERAA